MELIGKNAKIASNNLSKLSIKKKNEVLKKFNNYLKKYSKKILSANKKDIINAKKNKSQMIDRLKINDEKINQIRKSVNEIIKFNDPIGKILSSWKRPNGLIIKRISIPIGVVGGIYESRPNVTADVASLCFKSGNAVILRGGSEALHSNKVLYQLFKKALKNKNCDVNCVQFISNKDRNNVDYLLSGMKKYVDIIIPRGGKNLIKKIQSKSTVPTIGHLEGLCHVYIDKDADIKKAINIAVNSKTQRTGVCNAMETLIVNKDIANDFLPIIENELSAKNVEIRGCSNTKNILNNVKLANDDDWKTEYLASILSIIIVNDCESAIKHIADYGSGHTDVIVTENKDTAKVFLRNVDSSSVMHNASSRFADGFEYGLGAEIGISTNKLHARGPVGVKGLTNEKFVVIGDGNVR